MKRQNFDDKRSSSIHSFTNLTVSMVLSWQHRDAISLGLHPVIGPQYHIIKSCTVVVLKCIILVASS